MSMNISWSFSEKSMWPGKKKTKFTFLLRPMYNQGNREVWCLQYTLWTNILYIIHLYFCFCSTVLCAAHGQCRQNIMATFNGIWQLVQPKFTKITIVLTASLEGKIINKSVEYRGYLSRVDSRVVQKTMSVNTEKVYTPTLSHLGNQPYIYLCMYNIP